MNTFDIKARGPISQKKGALIGRGRSRKRKKVVVHQREKKRGKREVNQIGERTPTPQSIPTEGD